MFDTKHITAKGGKGGNGAISFLRERARPWGGPDGGDGGDGGSVILQAQGNLRALGHLARVSLIAAGDGGSGKGRDKTGRKGPDKRVGVPVGTVVWELNEAGDKRQLADLNREGLELVAARGGGAGRGNHRFAGPTNQEPLLAEAGEDGEERDLLLEVKLIADVAIVGVPNAGKSSLLTLLSHARPKIAGYPFTTLEPVLGVAEHRGRSLVLLDVPGLVEGASEGKGLGLEFLRHVERVRAMIHLVDGLSEDAAGEYQRIVKELEAYPHGLMEKPRVVALNKMDDSDVRELLEDLLASVETAGADAPLAISAITGENVAQLMDRVLQSIPEEEPEEPEMVRIEVERPKPLERVSVSVDDGVYVVSSHQAERLIPMVNLSNWSARLQFHRELERLHVLEALEQRGVEPGDTVRIGSYELEWQ
ncbi:MAG: GTPase ObgE [Dehalococcoidia bacterium]